MRHILTLILLTVPAQAQERVIAAITGVGDHGRDTIILEQNENDLKLLDLVIVSREDGAPDQIERYSQIFDPGGGAIPELFAERISGEVIIEDVGCFACASAHIGKQFTIRYHNDHWMVTQYYESYVNRNENWRQGICSVNLHAAEASIDLAEQRDAYSEIEDHAFPLSQLTLDYRPKICDRIDLSEEEWEALHPDGEAD